MTLSDLGGHFSAISSRSKSGTQVCVCDCCTGRGSCGVRQVGFCRADNYAVPLSVHR